MEGDKGGAHSSFKPDLHPSVGYPKIMALACPDCKTGLEDKRFYNIPISVCPKCAGIWLDGDDLYRIRVELNPDQIKDIESQVAPAAEALPTHPSNPPCPVCGHVLAPYHYMNGPVILHTCDNVCGIWVQDSEMDKIASVDEPSPAAVKVEQQYASESQAIVDHYDRVANVMNHFNVMRGFGFGWPLSRWFPAGYGMFGPQQRRY